MADGSGSLSVTPSMDGGQPAFRMSLNVSAGPQVDLAWNEQYLDGLTDIQVERRDVTAASAFATLASVTAAVASYGDVGPFTAQHKYAYRITAVGGTADGQSSESQAVFGWPIATRKVRRWR